MVFSLCFLVIYSFFPAQARERERERERSGEDTKREREREKRYKATQNKANKATQSKANNFRHALFWSECKLAGEQTAFLRTLECSCLGM